MIFGDKMAYQVCRASVVLAFGAAGQKEVILPDHLCRERERERKIEKEGWRPRP